MINNRFLETERRFHDSLAETDFAVRRLVNRLAAGLYDPDVYWEPVWRNVGNKLAGSLVLELGCGSGWMVGELASRGAWVYGVDISSALLRRAQTELIARAVMGRWCLIHADAHQLPFPGECFDFVFGSGVLHHLDFDRACQEVSRVLRPGGYAFFVEPLEGHPLVRAFRRLTPYARTPDERPLDFSIIKHASKYFSTIHHVEYYLLSVLVAPFNLLSPKLAHVLLKKVRVVDSYLLSRYRCFRKYSWIIRLEFQK
jgi:SAM-dependent methyltransferase